jgi:co-chaperonin GroES (HSP10)
MLNPDFVKETDKLIAAVIERGIQCENGNVMVAKVRAEQKTSGGIILTDDTIKSEEYFNGFARILALPPLGEGDPSLRVGDYVMFSYEARHKPHFKSLSEIFGFPVQENFVFLVPDNEIFFHISKEKI